MARNESRKFATMSDEERRRFALERGPSDAESAADELELGDPRDDDMGRQYPSLKAEVADKDARDGEAALLDDEAHRRSEARQRRGSTTKE